MKKLRTFFIIFPKPKFLIIFERVLPFGKLREKMPTRTELKKLAQTRLKESKILFSERQYDGAAYLAGYVIEMALKARICKLLQMDSYPDSGDISSVFKTHKYDTLVKLAGLGKKINDKKQKDTFFATNWSIVTEWEESHRYRPIGTMTKNETKDLMDSIEDPKHGVLTWIKKSW